MEVAKALGGSFKLVNASAKNCKGDYSTAQGNTKEWGQTNKSKSTNEHAKRKPRLSIEKNTLGPTGLYELVLAVHMENFQMYSLNVRGHFNCSPLVFS